MVQKVVALRRNLLRCILFCVAATIVAGCIRSGGTRLSCAVKTHMHQPYLASHWGSFGKSNTDHELRNGGKSSNEHLETARGMCAAAHGCAALAVAGPVHCRLSGKATQ